MITATSSSVTRQFQNLDEAMSWAKDLGEFVMIKINDVEVVGKFGADGITNGKLPNGQTYTWKKRRRSIN
jgi:hypothetical protein